jgi:hypothetical protein
MDDSGILSVSIRVGDGSPEVPLSLGFSNNFKYSTQLDYTNGLAVVFRATDVSNNSVTVTNFYDVVDPTNAVWNVDVTLYGVEWNVSSSTPLTVSIVRRTNTSTNIVDFLDGGMWDLDNELIRTSDSTHFATSFSNIATNNSVNGGSGYDLLVYRDDNNNGRYDVEEDFIITFDEIPVDGLSVYNSVYRMFHARGTLTLPYAVSNQLFGVMAIDYVYSGSDATLYGFGGGKIALDTSTVAYELALNYAGPMQIGAVVDTDGDNNPSEEGDFMGFYGSPGLLSGMPPFYKNVTITSNGQNVYDFTLYTNMGSYEF